MPIICGDRVCGCVCSSFFLRSSLRIRIFFATNMNQKKSEQFTLNCTCKTTTNTRNFLQVFIRTLKPFLEDFSKHTIIKTKKTNKNTQPKILCRKTKNWIYIRSYGRNNNNSAVFISKLFHGKLYTTDEERKMKHLLG